jgi:hypothetical protein
MDGGRWGRESRGAVSLLALGMALAFAEAFAGRAPVMRDFIGFTYPSRAAFRAVLEGGDLSTWNPLAELGLSRLSAPVHGALYPGHLFLLLGGLETGVVITWIVHVAWAGLGGYLLARAVGVRPAAAAISGAVWALSGYAVAMWWNGEKVLTCAWLPWFALAIERAVKARAYLSPWSVLAAIAASMICYTGDPFLLFHAFALALAVVLARSSPAPEGRFGELTRAALATVLGLGLAAPVLLTALAARGDTARSEPLTMAMAEAWSFHPVRWAELLIPGWFGNPFDVEHYPGAAFAEDPTRQALPWAVSVYCGATVLALAFCVRNRRVIASLGGVAALFLVLALGRHTPVNGLFCKVVPGLALFRYPEKHLVVTVGLVGLLAALGTEEALSKRAAAWRLAAPPLTLVVLSTLLAPEPLRSSVLAGALHAVLVVLILAGAVQAAHLRPTWSLLPALVAVLDLVVAARPLLRWTERPIFESPFMSAMDARRALAPPRIYRSRSADFEDAATLPGSAGQVFGVAALPGHDPASSLRLSTLLKRLDGQPGRMAALLAIDAFMLPEGAALDMSPTASLRGTSLYLLPPPPRAWIAGSVRVVSTAAALEAIGSETFDPYGEALVLADSDPALAGLARAAVGSAGTCTISGYDRAHVDLVCQAGRGGLAVLSELYAEGWTATVDGQETPLVPVDLVLRGVAVKAGIHRIAMRYETPLLAEGATVASASALLLFLGLLLVRSRDRVMGAATSPIRAAAD